MVKLIHFRDFLITYVNNSLSRKLTELLLCAPR